MSAVTRDRARRLPLAVGTAAALLALAACSGGGGAVAGTGEDELLVVTSSYPLEYVVTAVADGRAEVRNLTARGADSHATELSLQQVASLAEADLVVHLSGMQLSVDDALATQAPEHLLDAGSLADRDGDPHFWLDAGRMATLGERVAHELAALDPDGAAAYGAAADRLSADLEDLDAEYRQALGDCRGATLVTAHEAFGYLADTYALEQVGIAGIDPHVEPSPARLRDVRDVVEGRDVRTVFFEATTSSAVAQALADDLGLSTGVLHPIERVQEGQTYPDLMRANLAALQAGLTCASG